MSSTYVHNYWSEEPRLWLSGLALGLFVVTTAVHTYQLHRYRAFYFIAFLLGGYFQIIGFAARIYSTYNQTQLGPFVTQVLFVLLAPLMYAASIYGLLSRLIQLTGLERQMPIRPKWITTTFVTGDVLAFLMQASGGAMLSTGDPTKVTTGNTIVMAGLGIGLAFFVCFLAMLFRLQYLNRNASRETKAAYEQLLRVMQASSALILLRSVFRIVEYAGGYAGPIYNNEIYSYCFDSLLMFFVMVLYNWIHPGQTFAAANVTPAGPTSSVIV